MDSDSANLVGKYFESLGFEMIQAETNSVVTPLDRGGDFVVDNTVYEVKAARNYKFRFNYTQFWSYTNRKERIYYMFFRYVFDPSDLVGNRKSKLKDKVKDKVTLGTALDRSMKLCWILPLDILDLFLLKTHFRNGEECLTLPFGYLCSLSENTKNTLEVLNCKRDCVYMNKLVDTDKGMIQVFRID